MVVTVQMRGSASIRNKDRESARLEQSCPLVAVSSSCILAPSHAPSALARSSRAGCAYPPYSQKRSPFLGVEKKEKKPGLRPRSISLKKTAPAAASQLQSQLRKGVHLQLRNSRSMRSKIELGSALAVRLGCVGGTMKAYTMPHEDVLSDANLRLP